MKEKFSVLRKDAAAVGKTSALVLFMLLAVCATSVDVYGQSVLLADIAQSEEETYNEYSALTAAPQTLYFLGNSGTELWTATSTPDNNDQLRLMKKFVSASHLTVVGTKLYFVADDGVTGPELWKSDGTVSGTVRVKDIRAGATGSNPDMLTNVKGTLYFSANNGITGRELWKTNGTPAGTVLVKDILVKTGNGNPTSLTHVNGTLYFAANDGTNGIELWKSNGTAEGTFMVKDIKPGARVNSSPANLVNVYGTLFFVAGDATAGRELWKSNGTPEGTMRVKDIVPGINPSRIANTTAVYKTLFFSATDGIHGQELWKSDGTESGTVMVKDMTPGAAGSQGPHPGNKIANFTNMSGTLFFTASLKETNYIWKTNGTAQGTLPLTRTYGAEMTAPKPLFKLMNNRVYFLNGAEWEWTQVRLWSMDRNGSDMQSVMEVLQNEIPPNYPELAVVGTNLYVSGRPDYWYGFKLVKTDGTEEGTTWLDIRTSTNDSNPGEFIPFNGKVYFTADYSSLSPGTLWVTDGTPDGTSYFSSFTFNTEVNDVELVGNILFASSAWHFSLEKANLSGDGWDEPEVIIWDEDKQPIRFMINVNGTLFFSNGNGELWKTDGSNPGAQLKDFHAITDMHALNDKLVFRVLHEDGSEEIWGSNGTARGTVKIKTLHSGPAVRATYEPTAIIGNTLFFVANDGVHGNEVWKSNGTSAGTFMIADLNTTETGGAQEDDIGGFVPFGNTLYFSAKGNDGQWALHRKSLTNTVTKVLNMDRVWHGIALGDQLLLFTNENRLTTDTRTKLWTTDGTATGTKLVLELDGLDDTFSQQIVDGVLYFSTMQGGSLWRTDGTQCGTFALDIGTQGASNIAALGSNLIFVSYDVEVGREPHAYNTLTSPENPCAADMARLGASEEKFLSVYPNPFRNEFTLSVGGTADDTVEIRAFTIYGKPVEQMLEAKANTEHQLGQSWTRGIYVVQVIRKGVLTKYTVIKE